MANSASRRDPFLAFCFKVTIKEMSVNQVDLNEATGFFKSVGGLAMETEVVDYREGGVNESTHKLVGATKWKNIVLKRGFCGPELIHWRQKWLAPTGPKKRVSGTIEQLGTRGEVKAKWTFREGWPVKWELSEFDASKSEVSIETLEIAHEGLEFG